MLGLGRLVAGEGLLLGALGFGLCVEGDVGRVRHRRAATVAAGVDEATLFYGVGDHATEQIPGADGIVVAGDYVVDDIGVAVGVDHGDDGQTELPGFSDRDVLLLRVEHEDGIGQPRHATDAAEVALQLDELATEDERFLLRHGFEVAGDLHALVLRHLLHTPADRGEVGEHAAEPTLVDVRHPTAVGVRRDRILRLLLGTHEQDRAATGDEVADVGIRRLDAGQRLVQVDDVDAVALTEDESLHLGVPAAGLVSEVDARLKKLAHGDDRASSGHGVLL